MMYPNQAKPNGRSIRRMIESHLKKAVAITLPAITKALESAIYYLMMPVIFIASIALAASVVIACLLIDAYQSVVNWAKTYPPPKAE